MPALSLPRLVLLAGPVALAFFTGGFPDRPRLAALGIGGLMLAWAALAAPRPAEDRPVDDQADGRRTAGPLLALGGLTALAGWVALSRSWAPLADQAGDDAERVALYAIALTTGALAWRTRAAARMVEPGVALGTLIVTGYGLAGRIAPELVPQTASATAGGRFEQPLTYWNASGLYAVLGLVLCVRLAGDRERPTALRCVAVAAVVPLAAGTYLSFSRGALAALVAGLLVLLVLAPTRSQLRALTVALIAGGIGLLGPMLSDAVRTLEGSDATRTAQGAIVGLAMLAAAALGAGLLARAIRGEQRAATSTERIRLPRGSGVAALVIVAALVVVPVLVAGRSTAPTTNPAFGATSTRLASADSHRYDYWRVALSTWREHPLAGVGTGGYAVAWLAERPLPERIRDAHSLPLETLAELGLVGALLLAVAAGGIALCARRVQGDDPALAAGPAAALTAFALHACLDWDWELPAVTLTALALAGMLLARADAPPVRG